MKFYVTNRNSRSAKNSVKNGLLVVLAVLLGLLSAANWLYGLNFEQLPADNPLRRGYDHINGSVRGYEIRSSGVAAAIPAQMAVSFEGATTGIQYSLSELENGLQIVQPVWAQILMDSPLTQVSEEELIVALSGDCMLLQYYGIIPLNILADWLGGTWEESLAVSMLCYTASTQQVFVRTEDGTLYAAPVSIDAEKFLKAAQAFYGSPCTLAGNAYAVYPETLLFEQERLSLPLLTAQAPALFSPQSGTSLETLLDAFGYTPYTRTYNEQSGQVRVFVDGASTLRVGVDGLIQYAVSGASGQIYAFEDGEAERFHALSAQIDSARNILNLVLRAGDTDIHTALYTAQQDQNGRTTLVFLQLYGGIPVLRDSDFAVFVFEKGMLSSATIQLQKFQDTGTFCAIISSQLAATSAEGERHGLITAYRMRDNQYVPERFYWLSPTANPSA